MKFKISQRGVSIYLALMIMFILLAIGLGISLIIVSQMRMIRGMGDSVIAFYAADTGIDKTIFYDNKVIPSGGARGLCYMCDSSNPSMCTDCLSCSTVGTDCAPSSCTDCTISYYTTFDGKRYDVEAKESEGITTIKSSGSYKGMKRAIEITRIPPYKRVFVSSLTTTGDIVSRANGLGLGPFGSTQGIEAADAICQYLADNAGLLGTYKAWITDSDTNNAPADPIGQRDFTHSTIPYRRVDTALVANDWADLTTQKMDGSYLRSPINKDELSISRAPYTFTNVRPDGTRFSAGDHCKSWTQSIANSRIGNPLKTNSEWTSIASGKYCNWANRLYCFQQ